MNLKNKKVLFLGDSVTEGCGASSLDTCYVSLFKKNYPEAEIYNYGIGGTRIAKKLNGPSEIEIYDRHFSSRIDEMQNDADLVVVFGGTNDYGHGDAPLGEFGDTEENTFYGALYSLYVKLLEKYPTAKFLVITPLHRLGEDVPNAQGNVLKQFVDAIRQTAELFSLPVLDLYKVSGMNPNFAKCQETMMPDGLHPNDCGYVRLYEIINAYISNTL